LKFKVFIKGLLLIIKRDEMSLKVEIFEF